MDFSGWFQVWLSGQWFTFDARHNIPRRGRILMGTGRDAADVALSTSFGRMELNKFVVVSDEVAEGGVSGGVCHCELSEAIQTPPRRTEICIASSQELLAMTGSRVYRAPMTSDRLFVYGTLMRGFDHPMARLLAGHADFLGEATCRGRLVLVKHYPGLLLSDAASDIVHGELFHLRVPDELLGELDMYEAWSTLSRATEYLRHLIDVTLPDGTSEKASTTSTTGPSPICRASRQDVFLEH